jgi:signal transduction histidine kinase
MSQFLTNDFGDKLDDAGKEFLEIIVQSSDRMTRLINELLEFATAGKVEFAKEPVSLSQMLSDIQADLSFLIKERNVKVSVQSDLPAVQGDPVRLSQVWRNLISNSIKYNDKRDPTIDIGFHERDGTHVEYEFYVKDNGIGIAERLLGEIFLPFRRATTDPQYEGTGIGLAIVKRVLEFHGGRIQVESKLGEGTTFRFTLPKPSTVPSST